MSSLIGWKKKFMAHVRFANALYDYLPAICAERVGGRAARRSCAPAAVNLDPVARRASNKAFASDVLRLDSRHLPKRVQSVKASGAGPIRPGFVLHVLRPGAKREFGHADSAMRLRRSRLLGSARTATTTRDFLLKG